MKTPPRTNDASDLRLAAGPEGFFARLNRFWFGSADPTTLGLIRICTGLVVLYVHLAYTFDLQALFGRDAWLNLDAVNALRREMPIFVLPTDWDPAPIPENRTPEEQAAAAKLLEDWGVDPVHVNGQGRTVWSIWFHVTDPTWMMTIHIALLVGVSLFTVGFCTRLTSVLTFFAALSFIHRSPITLFGMDTMLTIALVYLMVGDCGAALSLDRLLERRIRGARGEEVGEPRSVSANFAIRLMQIHFCFIYLAAGTSKLLGGMWWNGTALWFTMANYEFSPMDIPPYVDFLRWLSSHRWLWELVCSGGVFFTLALEISFPYLVWMPRLRGVMIGLAVLLHTGIALSMGLTLFGLAMMILLLSFVPPELVRRLLTRATGTTTPPALSVAA